MSNDPLELPEEFSVVPGEEHARIVRTAFEEAYRLEEGIEQHARQSDGPWEAWKEEYLAIRRIRFTLQEGVPHPLAPKWKKQLFEDLRLIEAALDSDGADAQFDEIRNGLARLSDCSFWHWVPGG